jgi:hypothetical protein
MGSGLDGFSSVLIPLRGDLGQGTIPSLDFYRADFTPSFHHLQGGDREFSWSGPPLMFVLTPAKVRTSYMGQPLQMTLWLLSQWTDSFVINHPSPIAYLQLMVLAAQLMCPILTSHYGSSFIQVVFSSCFLQKSRRMGLSRWKNRHLVLQKALYTLSTVTLDSIPHAWVGSCMNCSVPSLTLMSYSTVLLLSFFSQALSFFLLGGGRVSGFLSFILSITTILYTFQLQHFKTFLNAYGTLHFIKRTVLRE